MEAVDQCFALGISRVLLGTAALKNPTLVYQACARYPGRIGISVDARDGFVATEGWVEASMINAIDLALRLKMAGVSVIVFTDIGRDGTMKGVNVQATAELARTVEIPVIASGGVSSIDDIAALLPHENDGIIGAIAGRALYEGAIIPKQLHDLLKKAA
jgi:phosphoribosylformimino-5-aminoimidazole carboxamide ribotide isomerase